MQKLISLQKKPLYKRIVKQIIKYLNNEMLSKNGGFYSATDADSSGEEGLFFIWDIEELKNILGDDLKEFERYFDLSNVTNFEDKNVIHFKNINAIDDFSKIDKMLTKLYISRNKREKPLLDNKILLSWNALLLKAFVIAGEIDDIYLDDAKKLASSLINTFFDKSKLLRVNIQNKTTQIAIFEDYAYFADSLIALFDKTGNKKYLNLAQKLTNDAINKFWDKKNYGFKISNNKRIIAQKEIYDGAMFSSNGVIYGVLNDLSERLQDNKYKEIAQKSLNFFSSKIIQKPDAYAGIVQNINNYNFGKLDSVNYLYNGKIKIKILSKKITIEMAQGWHINANKVLQKNLVATQIESPNLKNIIYPSAQLINLGFSKDKLLVYKNKIVINYQLKKQKNTVIKLKLQACSNKVCLPPKTISLIKILY